MKPFYVVYMIYCSLQNMWGEERGRLLPGDDALPPELGYSDNHHLGERYESNELCYFMAPTGAQEVTLSVCLSVRLSVRPAQVCLEHSIFISEPQILHDDFMKSS